jgi:uncharacterized protein (UPF0371 family)
VIDDPGGWNITVWAVVITRFEGQESAQEFRERLERRGVRVHTHRFTKDCSTDVGTIVSDEGYAADVLLSGDQATYAVLPRLARGKSNGNLVGRAIWRSLEARGIGKGSIEPRIMK